MRDMPNLDFVRSIAVMSVVFEHLLLVKRVYWLGSFEVDEFGVIGVLVFFVLTCLVLMWSLERKPHTLDFYIRRVFRIYPLVLVVLTVIVAFHVPVSGTPHQVFAYAAPTLKSFIEQVLLFPGSQESLLTLMWTLSYEVTMYILLPVLFFFVQKNFSIWPLLLLWALILAEARHMVNPNFAVTIGYFLPGIMAYVGYRRWKAWLPSWSLPIALLGLWVLFWYHFNFRHGWLFCLLLGLGLPLFRQMQSTFVLKPSQVVAKYSYGIYLTHPFALVLGFHVLASHVAWMQWTAFFVALVALPVAAYHVVELPLIRIGSRLASKAEKRYEQREFDKIFPAPLEAQS